MDSKQAELLKLSEALLACQRELAQLHEQWERREEEACQLRGTNVELAERASQLAGASAEFLADKFWNDHGHPRPIPLRTYLLSHWPWLRRLLHRSLSAQMRMEMQQVRLIEASELFDARWYLERRPDVAAAGVHPALHYLCHGAAEVSDPGPNFDARAYRRDHPDLDTNTNPLLHYLQTKPR